MSLGAVPQTDFPQQSVKVPIPASVRQHIIGRQGQNVSNLTQRTGAKIQVPRMEEAQGAGGDDEDLMVDVTIEGDAVAAEMARREIERIANEHTSAANLRLRDMPPELYPFLIGANNSGVNALEEGRNVQVQIPQYHQWLSQPPPQVPAQSQPPQFVAHHPHPSTHIQISGDRREAQEVKAMIERQIDELRRQITLSQLSIPRGQHQFVIGERGSSLNEFLSETGCAVILPPDHDDTEVLTIVGPPEKIDLGVNKVMDLATSMQMASVDLSRQHLNAPRGSQAHARSLTRYLQQRQVIQELENLHNSRISLPTSTDAPMTWEVYSRDGKNTIRARSDIMSLVNAHPPARFSHLDIDPFYHQHLQRQSAQQMRDDFGVQLVIPEDAENEPVLLVYEGPSGASPEYQVPRSRPTPAEVAEFERVLREAQQHVLGLMSGQNKIVTTDIEVPKKFHDKLRRYVVREQAASEREFPVRIQANASQDRVSLRGPTDAVEEMESKIRAFVVQAKQDELERGFTLTFDYPQKFANHLIGRKGENINKIREEFDVEIQLNDGKVEVKGPQAKAEAAKTHILSMSKKLEDEETHVLKIKPQFHRDLIGVKGAQVNRLQDRYKVRVQFPRTAQVSDENADAASEVGGSRNNRNQQAPDEVIIRGPKRGADEAREEILNLLQWTMDHSHTATVSVAQNQIAQLIGQGGREMDNVRMTTEAQIDVPNAREAADASGRVEIRLKGTKKQVEEAKKLLQERVKVFDDTITKSVDVDRKYHRALIGAGGKSTL